MRSFVRELSASFESTDDLIKCWNLLEWSEDTNELITSIVHGQAHAAE